MIEPLPPEVAKFRDEYRRSQIGPFYRGWAHFAFTSIASLGVIGFAISRVHAPTWRELLTLPVSFLVANAAEYFGHRGPMHRPRAGMRLLFQRHTREHHHFYTHDAMSYGSSRDFKMVLFPPVMLFFFLGVLATPIGLLVYEVVSPNCGWLFVVVAMSYFLTYEWLHFIYHLSPASTVGGAPFFRALRKHHRNHHDKALMGKYNFNITFPICDLIMGTIYREIEHRDVPAHLAQDK